jgi:hypothetical protein
MKLRLRGNSLRLRLTQREVNDLVALGSVEEKTAFGPQALLSYAIALGEGASVSASFEAGAIRVTVPLADARAWATSDRVGIEAEQATAAEGEPLRLLIEKDFACLKPRTGEDDRDAFPNPNPTC